MVSLNTGLTVAENFAPHFTLDCTKRLILDVNNARLAVKLKPEGTVM